MARVQLEISDEERDRFVRQARREGMSLSAWLRAAGRERLEVRQRPERFETPEDLKRFFERCDEREGPGVEPDWEEHKRNIEASRLQGLPDV